MSALYQRERIDDFISSEQNYDRYISGLMVLKTKQHDQSIDRLNEQVQELYNRIDGFEKWEKYNTNFNIINVSKLSESRMEKREQTDLTNDIVREIEALEENEDIRDQIAICTSVAQKTLKLLKMMPKSSEDNYKKNIVHLFYQAIKRNYARKHFTKEQIDVLVRLMKESKNMVVSEDKYFEYDEELYNCDLEVFPIEG